MTNRVRKWGNSLALRIPKNLVLEAGLSVDAAVELSLVEGAIVVRPVVARSVSLDELLRGVTDDNRPSEWDVGSAVGKEVL